MKKTASFYFFKRKPIVLQDKFERWRGVATYLNLSPKERLRMEWMIFYYTVAVERFIETLIYEWLNDFNFMPDCDEFNVNLTEWLIEYNFNRPHQSLDYLTPIEYIEKHRDVLPMCPATTRA